MSSNYDKIREKNIRDYGQKTSHLKLLGEKLYTEKTHFIFELLQNAEDENATNIQFNLYSDRLEILHNGKPFTEANVEGICGFGAGTKTDDFTKIGKIGIGFKSVYAFTASPEVHSGDEHFKIEHYVRPFLVPKKNIPSPWTTLFVLPFNRDDKMDKELCCQKISKGLKEIKLRSILFLRNIKFLEYNLFDGVNGRYSREVKSSQNGRIVTLNGKSGQTTFESEKWLIFEKPIKLPEINNKINMAFVEIAFHIKNFEIDGNITKKIIRDEDTPLTVFFPTEKDTYFGFLIQGPYITNSSRNNIPKDDDWNDMLINETSQLFINILPQIKSMNLLNLSFIESLPIKPDNFNKDNIFSPISITILKQLQINKLLPASDGTYVSAQNAKLARGDELRKLINYKMLNELHNSENLKWLSDEFPQNTQNILYQYITGENYLKIESIEPEDFCRKAVDTNFFEKNFKNIRWFKNFYIFLNSREALWRRGDGYLRNKPFILLEDDSIRPLFNNEKDEKPGIYLPLDTISIFPTVKRALLEEEEGVEIEIVRNFFSKKLGMIEPDIIDEVTLNVLTKYKSNVAYLKETDEEHNINISKIFSALKTDSIEKRKRLIDELKSISFLRARNLYWKNNVEYKKPSDIYFNNDNLRIYFTNYGKQDFVWFLDESLEAKEYDLLKEIGVMDLPKRVSKKTGNFTEWRKEGNILYEMQGIENFLLVIRNEYIPDSKKKKSLILWKILCENLSRDQYFFYDEHYEFYYSQKFKRIPSIWIQFLLSYNWIPTKENNFKKPLETSISHLCEEIKEDIQLIRELNIPEKDKTALELEKNKTREEELKDHAKALDISLDDVTLMKNNHEDFQKWKTKIIEKNLRKEFPDKKSLNPQLRNERVKEIAAREKERSKLIVERTITVTDDEKTRARSYLRYYYEYDKQMHCQICGSDINESPFQTADEKWHFEVSPFLPSLREKLHRENFLALCHNHAAMFSFIAEKEMEKIEKFILERKINDKRCIGINLIGQNRLIWFTQEHLTDLKALLELNKEGTSE